MGYPPPQGAPQPNPHGTMPQGPAMAAKPMRGPDKNFFEALFDFKFDYFVTTKVIKVIYGLGLIAVVFAFLAAEYAGIEQLDRRYGHDEAWMMILGAPFAVPVGVVILRVYCEMLVVFFRMAEHLRTLTQKA